MLTLSAGVLCCYVALLVVNMVAAALVLPVTPLESTLTHPVDVANYLRLAAFVTAAATVGGALGSGFDSDEAVRRAAYGRRERARRELAAEQRADQESGRSLSSLTASSACCGADVSLPPWMYLGGTRTTLRVFSPGGNTSSVGRQSTTWDVSHGPRPNVLVDVCLVGT